MEVEELAWDSDFFGLPVASVKISPEVTTEECLRKIKDLRSFGVRLVYVTKEIYGSGISHEWLTQRGAFLVDEKVTYLKTSIHQKGTSSGPVSIEEYEGDIPTDEMYELAIASGQYSRFRADPKIPKQKFGDLYRMWIENSVKKQIADAVLVARMQERILGLVTVKFSNGTGTIGIIAVSPAARGQGLGKRLMQAAENGCAEQGLEKMKVVTQFQNLPAWRLYEGCGYRLSEQKLVYHWWL